MSMFEELFALASHATLTLIVSADTNGGKMTVSVIPKPKDDNGEAALRQPLSLTATPQEFDAGFLEALRGYREVRASLAEQAAATQEVLEAAKSASVKKASEAASKAGKPASTPSKAAAAAPKADAPAEQRSETAATDPAAKQPEAMDLFG
ncbi:PRTRC system protein E [Xanthomonas hortorum]|uniref:PRTRC system protein E n=1 Tax=Xanthomonas hortorum pv. hederae TaxID=453603 RepID=A0A9X4H6S4_9XANT|nr:PRTRC system protein E [Xanthomonas hortorum]MCE4369728.1 PRTRC system protein E [Xanthomonas hortorum pv. hederae]MDC8638743.1 PRTRC system protein E [Xanthomonas hortorum pv. hederae]PPU86262.1 PRTRC system protein E [Xanthomonas hortorum pv. hederae]PUF01389.1 PRTRC system protein E [Xanthomonas hortorum pv. hederae]